VAGQVPTTRDPALFAMWIQLTRGHTAEQADAILLEEVGRLVARAVEPAELEAARSRLETELWRELGSSRGRAELLGHFEVVAGDFRLLTARAEEYARVSAPDVQRAASTFLAGRARSVVIARPAAPNTLSLAVPRADPSAMPGSTSTPYP